MSGKMEKFLIIVLFSFSIVHGLFSTLTQRAPVFVDKFVFITSGGNVGGYLGASANATNMNKNSIMYVHVQENEETEENEIKINGMVLDRGLVNFNRRDKDGKLTDGKEGDIVDSPVYNKVISSLAVLGGVPVVVLATDDKVPILGVNQKICMIQGNVEINKTTVGQVITNSVKLKDGGGAYTSGIVGIATSSGHIFAAVAPNGGVFGQNNSAISLLYHDQETTNQLVPVNTVTGVRTGNTPIKLHLTAISGMIALSDGATDAILENDIVDMYWDNSLSRLFIALKATRANVANPGGVVSLLVGRVDSSNSKNPHKLILEPIVSTRSKNFTVNSVNHILGFYRRLDMNNIWSASYKVRTLHTSTQKSYLILNGMVYDVAGGDIGKNRIYALPLTSGGKIANKSDFEKGVSGVADMTLATDAAAIVGAGNLPNNHDQDVRDIFTAGDAVFVCLSGRTGVTSDPERQGIFYSAALFANDGKIERWTPWQRVMGSTNKVIGGNIFFNDGNFMYLTLDSTTNQTDTIKVTQWGGGAKDGLLGGTSSDESVGLVSLFINEFPKANGGVYQLFNFDRETPTFKQGDENLSLVVATGYKKISLIETGSKAAGGNFLPNAGAFNINALRATNGYAAQGVAGIKAMMVSGGVLDTIGPLCCADLSRCDLAGVERRGWLFVSGPDGVAVLSDDNGNGWNTAIGGGLQRGFVGITNNMSFKKLGNFSWVRKVVCDGTNLYVLTRKYLYKIPLINTNFSSANAGSVTGTILKSAPAGEILVDFFVSSKLGLLSTNNGLFRVGDGKNIVVDNNLDWTEVKMTYGGVQYSFGPIVCFDMLSATKGGFSQGGNLYVLEGNYSLNRADVWRFNIQDTRNSNVGPNTVKLITESGDILQFFSLGRYRGNIKTDGSLFFHLWSKDFGQTDFLKMVVHRINLSQYPTRGNTINLGLDSTAYNVGIISRNSASGAWMIPGDYGIRVNE